MLKFRNFTLIEVVVAITIMVLMCSVAMTYIRDESPQQILDRGTLEFRAFCSQVRFRAAETGQEWVVYYEDESRTFNAVAAQSKPMRLPDTKEEELEAESDLDPIEAAKYQYEEMRNTRTLGEENTRPALLPLFSFVLPARVEFSIAKANEKSNELDIPELGERQEILRFYADGTGGGGYRMTFAVGNTLAKTYNLSPLTGLLIEQEGDAENTREFTLDKYQEENRGNLR